MIHRLAKLNRKVAAASPLFSIVTISGLVAAMGTPVHAQQGKGDFSEYARQYCSLDVYKNRMPEAVDQWMVASMGDEWIYGEKARAKTAYEKSEDRIKAQIKALQDNTNRAYGMTTAQDQPQSDMIVRTPRKRSTMVIEAHLKSFVPWEEVICTATVRITFTPPAGKQHVYEFRDLDYRIRGDESGKQTWVEAYNWPAYGSDAFSNTLFLDGITLKAVGAQRQAEAATFAAFIEAADAKDEEETRRRGPACEAAGGTWGYRTRDGIRAGPLGCYFQTARD